MLVACLYARLDDELLSFAAITDEPPAEVAAAGHDRCVVSIKEENVEAWLTPEGRSVKELQAILDDVERPYYEHEVLAA
jgi:putative SOS response-associated peptidase YedK